MKLEPSRTNKNLFSTDFSQFTAVEATLDKSFTAPDGTLNATKLTDNSVSSTHRIIKTCTTSSSGSVTYSVFLKKGTMINAVLNLFSGSTIGRATVDLDSGTITLNNGTSADIEDYGDDWYRCSLTGTLASTSTTIYVYMGDSTSSYVGTNQDLYVWGAQLEEGSYATSYIPTQGGVVTRVADNAYQQSVTQVIGQSEGTMYIDFIPKSKDDFQILYQIRTTGSSNVGQIDIRLQAGNIRALGNDGGSTQFNINGIYFDVGTRYKCAIRYKQNDVSFYINGVLIGNDLSASFSSSSKNQVSFGENLTSFLPIANIIDARLYNNGLTDQELINLTTI